MDLQLETTRKIKIVRGIYYITLGVFLLFYLLPFWGAITTSLKSAGEVLTTNPLSLPQQPTLKGYIDAFNHLEETTAQQFAGYFRGAFFSVLFGSICGYVFALYRFKLITSSLC